MPRKEKARKVDNDTISNNPLSTENKYIEKQKAEAAADKLSFNNKPVKYIKRGATGNNH